jgi:hypothetical protein
LTQTAALNPFDSGIIPSSALPRSRRCDHRRRLDPAVALALVGSRQLQRDSSFVRVAGFASAGSCSWNTRAWASSPCPRGCHSTQTLRSNLPLPGGNDGSIFLISFIRSIRGVNSACKAKSGGISSSGTTRGNDFQTWDIQISRGEHAFTTTGFPRAQRLN